ncbi:MAG: nitrate transporter [Hydrocarboniphaga sp.]|uniref:CmpA/NrtA family ABC transporter substrate-binding protein n=1 Tax=Hydrocarboniphaga sp. TaxID=2033016 RepID=UPI00262EA6C3|nr:CmpA/NrtA family ABC transporter substrate-binding protein [Hydrocarboniphaga sp.]MDB5970653.1 nitrate transporter [Hydrocarboniphaga sp.]
MALEKNNIKLGLVPLIDAAPLIIAKEKGFFEAHGLDVTLSIEASWASIRDKVAAGLLDAAHMLAPMPIAATAGVDGVGVPMLTALSLNLNGNAIAVSQSLYWRLQLDELSPRSVGERLKRVLDADRAAGAPPRVFAHVFPFSPHYYELRYWLAGCDIDPDRDLQLVVIPPPQMVSALRDGSIDGFCVGAPWGAVAQAAGIGRVVVNKYQIWNNSPEKVLGVTRAWAEAHPETHLALIAALIETARWLDKPEHRAEAARLVVEGHYLEATPETVHESLLVDLPSKPENAGLVFHAGAATFPWVSHAMWFISQMRRWNQLPANVDARAIADACYRPDLYRAAAARLGQAYPSSDIKSEGHHSMPRTLPPEHVIEVGSDRFFDGATYDPN